MCCCQGRAHVLGPECSLVLEQPRCTPNPTHVHPGACGEVWVGGGSGDLVLPTAHTGAAAGPGRRAAVRGEASCGGVESKRPLYWGLVRGWEPLVPSVMLFEV